jgi:hypothetical protein
MPPLGLLSIGSLVSVAGEAETRGLPIRSLADGSAIVAKTPGSGLGHTSRLGEVAEAFVGTPYLWGGRSSLGLDCSALVQLAAQTGGIRSAADSDMQEAEAGTEIPHDDLSSLRRGDLLFWKGPRRDHHRPEPAASRQRPHHDGGLSRISTRRSPAHSRDRMGRDHQGAAAGVRPGPEQWPILRDSAKCALPQELRR